MLPGYSTTCRASATAFLLLLSFCLIGGCSAPSFFDQTEMGRYPKTPLLVPILDNLDTGYEEGDARFATATGVRPRDLNPIASDYVISKNDFLLVSITDLQGPGIETYKQVRVSESGNLSLPYIKQIKAAGLTEAALEEAIAQTYKDLNLIDRAQVSVSVQEARGRTFTITGAIVAAGQYAIYDSNFRMLDALALARGVSSQGVENIYVVRKLEMDPEAQETAPDLAPAPATQPAPDILVPQSRATPNPRDAQSRAVPARKVALLKTQAQEATANQPVPADVPQTAPSGEQEGRIVVLEGKPVQVDGTEMPPTEPVAEPAPEPVDEAPSTQGFEFNELQEPGDLRIIRVNYEALQRGELKYNIIIRPQDMIIVPDPVVGEYYMGGHVQRTGVYSLTARKITLKQAIISAGMLDQLAVPWNTSLTRRIGPSREISVRVNLTKIFAGQEPDMYLKPYDQVMVGTDFWAPFLAAARNGFRVTYGFGFLYDRNFAPENNQGF